MLLTRTLTVSLMRRAAWELLYGPVRPAEVRHPLVGIDELR